MIQINLLDSSQVKNRSKRAHAGGGKSSQGGFGSIVVALAAIGMIAANAVFGWNSYQTVSTAGNEARSLEAKLKAIDEQIEKSSEASQQIRMFEEVVNNQKEVLRTLDPPDRLLWCEKLNMLSNLMPTQVFISEINVREVVEMIETEQSKQARQKWEKLPKNKRGEEPEVVKKPVVHYDVTLTGLASGADNVAQFDNVLAFHKAIIDHKVTGESGAESRFMDGFVQNIDFGAIEATVYDGVPVNKFVFKLRTLDQGGEDKKDKRPATNMANASSRRNQLDEVLQ